MLERYEKVLMALVGIMIVVLLGLMSLQLVAKPANRTCKVSVITDDGGGEAAHLIQKGADKAAMDFNADIQYVSAASVAQDLDSFVTETENALGAIVIVSSNGEVVKWFAENTADCVVVSTNPAQAMDGTIKYVGLENKGLGALLAEKIAQDGVQEVYIFADDIGAAHISQRYDGFTERCDALGVSHTLLLSEESRRTFLEGVDTCNIVSFSADTTKGILEATGEENVSIYGIESAVPLLEFVENGSIACLIVQNNYNIGYLAVVEAIKTGSGLSLGSYELKPNVLTKDTLYTDEMSYVIAPVY